MNTASALCALHERLTSDDRVAFQVIVSRRDNPDIELTPAGSEWLHDWHEYNIAWRHLERSGEKPDVVLNAVFGYVLEEDVADDATGC